MSPTNSTYPTSYGWAGTNNVPVYSNQAQAVPTGRSAQTQPSGGNVNLFSQDFISNLGGNVPQLNNPYQPASPSQPTGTAANGKLYGRGGKAGMVPNYGTGSSGQQGSNPLADILAMFGGGGGMGSPASPQFPTMAAPSFQSLQMPAASQYGVDTSLDFNLGQPLFPQIPSGGSQGGGGGAPQPPQINHVDTGIQSGQINPGYMQQVGQNLQALHNAAVGNMPRVAGSPNQSAPMFNLMQSQFGPSMSAIGSQVHPANAQHALASQNANAQAGAQGMGMAAQRYGANLQNQNRSFSNLISWLQSALGGSL
jgi:hypothetical protein